MARGGQRSRYTPTAPFETFPSPAGLTPDIPATAVHALVEARNRWLNPPDLVERVPAVVPGFPDFVLPSKAKAAAALKTRTLTNLSNIHGKPEGAPGSTPWSAPSARRHVAGRGRSRFWVTAARR